MVLIIVILSCVLMYRINKALIRLEFKQEALCYDIYVLNNQSIKEEQTFLREASGKI